MTKALLGGRCWLWTLVAVALPLLQAGLFAGIILWHRVPGPADKFELLAVFGGDPDRAKVAIDMARQGIGQAIVISDSDQWQLRSFFSRFGSPGQARVLVEPLARTTDQNARLVGRIIRREGFRRVLLITSWYHLPRAYLLLRLELLGAGVKVDLMSAEETPDDFYSRPEFREELVKLWGSLGRWGKSLLRVHGLVPGQVPRPTD